MKLLELRKIWDKSSHNAFTDLIKFNNYWYCTFREGEKHICDNSKIRVIKSYDGITWVSVATFNHKDGDLRDPKLSITSKNELMINAVIRLVNPIDNINHQSLTWISKDGENWSDANICPSGKGTWRWSTTWHKGMAYSMAYSGKHTQGCLYSSKDGKSWSIVQDKIYPDIESFYNESSLVFLENSEAYCLLRSDNLSCHAMLGKSKPPYTKWQWNDLGRRIGGPKMIALGDEMFISAVRLNDTRIRTSICYVNPIDNSLTEEFELLSSGDCSYCGLVLEDNILWVSYYSSHEGKASIYLAKLEI